MVHPPFWPGHDAAEVVEVVVGTGVVVTVTVDSIQLQSVLRNPPPCLVQLAHTEHAPEQVPDVAVVVVGLFVVVVGLFVVVVGLFAVVVGYFAVVGLVVDALVVV